MYLALCRPALPGYVVAIIVISLLLDEAGSFEWTVLRAARWCKGNGQLPFRQYPPPCSPQCYLTALCADDAGWS
jgi:hypothetical protein